MIWEKDWLMRQIQTMIATLLHFLTHTQTQPEKIPNEERACMEKIAAWLQKGEFCKAEDWLVENLDEADMMWLRLAVFFYSEANKCPDPFLEENNFPREEIEFGLRETAERFGYGELL